MLNKYALPLKLKSMAKSNQTHKSINLANKLPHFHFLYSYITPGLLISLLWSEETKSITYVHAQRVTRNIVA